ncbi:uncharacterized protein LOC134536889 isoform X2 [Bacillus rossius redtenbacheri]|uniref:uncharacterized protein LOC134536889 isoform X2 n=1 Tax=Bacillus rossius redtenbacheri TaxID=93214 RepID=UPI002FDE9232
MEDTCIFPKRMKKLMRNIKNKSTKLLSRSRSASTNNLSNTNTVSLHPELQSEQSLVVKKDSEFSEVFIGLANEKILEASVVNSISLGSGNVEVKDLSPSIQFENDTGNNVVALRKSTLDIYSINDEETASSVNTTLCLYELPPAELVQLDDVPSNQLDILRNEALQEANREYPIKCYDFCLICCDEDYEIAEEIKEKLCSSFDLVGCMIQNDGLMLGRDVFQAYEFMMERSTKVLFLITNAFNRDPFNQRLQNGAVFQTLMSRVKKEKCVPVFPYGLREVPLPLSGISGISCNLPPKVLSANMRATYTEEVRSIRVKKEQVLLDMRNMFYNEALARKAEQLRAKMQQQQSPALGAAAAGSGDVMAITRQDGPSQSTEAVRGLDGILGSVGLPAAQKDSVMGIVSGAINTGGSSSTNVIGSEQVRIGHDISIVVHVSQNGAAEYEVDDSQKQRRHVSFSSDSSSSDSDTDTS